MRPSQPLTLSSNHHTSSDVYVVAPATASSEGLPPPQFRRCIPIAATTVDDDCQLRSIRCRLYEFILTFLCHPLFLYVPYPILPESWVWLSSLLIWSRAWYWYWSGVRLWFQLSFSFFLVLLLLPFTVAIPGGGSCQHNRPCPSPKLQSQQATYTLLRSSLPSCWRHRLHHYSPHNWSRTKSRRRNLPPPSIPLRRFHPLLPCITYPLLMCIGALPPTYFPPSLPPYVPKNYHTTPWAAVSLSVPAPVDEDEDDNPRRKRR